MNILHRLHNWYSIVKFYQHSGFLNQKFLPEPVQWLGIRKIFLQLRKSHNLKLFNSHFSRDSCLLYPHTQVQIKQSLILFGMKNSLARTKSTQRHLSSGRGGGFSISGGKQRNESTFCYHFYMTYVRLITHSSIIEFHINKRLCK